MDLPFIILNGFLCAAAVVFAAHVKHERSAAVTLAVLMAVGWAFYIAAWTPASPAAALADMGIPISSKDLWAIMDAMFGVAALGLASTIWWGWAFWATALAATVIHLNYRFGGTDFDSYSHALDKVLLAQMAIFFLIGGRGVSDRVCSFPAIRRLGVFSKICLSKEAE